MHDVTGKESSSIFLQNFVPTNIGHQSHHHHNPRSVGEKCIQGSHGRKFFLLEKGNPSTAPLEN
jgi:hypothetical protein